MSTPQNPNQQINQHPLTDHHDELILVVKRADFFYKEPAWSGLKEIDAQPYLDIIAQKKEFLPRAAMEIDPAYKQIIPYLVFKHQDCYFIMQRKATSSESRLQSKFSLGIGGHVRKEDLESNSLIDWAMREFHEEVDYQGKLDVTFLGIINDDANAVGQVHVGFVFVLEGEHDKIAIKSELKSGELVTLEACKSYFNRMESWSQIVFEALLKLHQL